MNNLYIFGNIDKIANAIHVYCPTDYLNTISWADCTASGFITHRAHYEMERCRIEVKETSQMWNTVPPEIPNHDPEWIYALSRHSIILNLAKAYAYTKDDKYIKCLEKLLSSFFLHADKKGESWRSLEVGIRPENWIRTMEMLSSTDRSLSNELMSLINKSLDEHIKILVETHTAFHRLSNWGIIQDHGLFVASLYLERKETLDLALKRLEEEASLQFMEDGTLWEQSPLYHAEVLHCLLDTIMLSRRFGISLPAMIEQKAQSGAVALYSMVSSKNTIFMQGDSDEIEVDDLIYQAKMLFPDLEIDANKAEENYWDFGPSENIGHRTQRKSCFLPDSRNVYLRGKAIEAHLFYGSMGSGHGNISPLHVDVYAQRESFIVDSGRYTYTDCKERNELRSLKFHNCPMLDNESPDEPIGSWGFSSIPLCSYGNTKLEKEYDYADGTNLSYLYRSSAIRRKLIRLGDSIIVVLDELISEGSHQIDIRWHLDTNIKIKHDGKYTMLSKEMANLYLWTNSSSISIEDSKISKEYNKLEDNKCLRLSNKTRGITTIATVFSTECISVEEVPIMLINSNRTLLPNEGISLDIKTKDEHWSLISRAKEIVSPVDIIKSGSIEGYGMTIIKKDGWRFSKSIF